LNQLPAENTMQRNQNAVEVLLQAVPLAARLLGKARGRKQRSLRFTTPLAIQESSPGYRRTVPAGADFGKHSTEAH